MIIRCERCSTMYELDESLLAPGGSAVQCTRCEHIFTAFPPPAVPDSSIDVPPQPAEDDPPACAPLEPEARPEFGVRPDAGPRPVRGGAPPVYRPSGPTSTVGRTALLKRDTIGTFEARLRWHARWRWLAPAVAATLVLTTLTGWFLLSRRRDAGPSRGHVEALALVALDDGASLDEAAAKLARLPRRGRDAQSAAADRALALVLRAAGLADEREALSARFSAAVEERERRARDGSPAPEADEGLAALRREVLARDERVRALSDAAADQINAAEGALAGTPEVVRARAALHALRGERRELQKLLGGRRESTPRDPWLDLAEGWMDVRDPDRSVRERAISKLGVLAAAHPDLLRGRYLLARAEASLGRRAEALATIEAVIAANGRHEGARRLRDELSAQADRPAPASSSASAPGAVPLHPAASPEPAVPSPAHAAPGNEAAPPSDLPAPAVPAAAPPEKASPHARKSLAQPVPGASQPPGAAVAGAQPTSGMPSGTSGGTVGVWQASGSAPGAAPLYAPQGTASGIPAPASEPTPSAGSGHPVDAAPAEPPPPPPAAPPPRKRSEPQQVGGFGG